jgi:plastocyanin
MKRKYLPFLGILMILGLVLVSGAGCFVSDPLSVSIDSAPSSVVAGQSIDIAWSIGGARDYFYHGAVYYGPFPVSNPGDVSNYPVHPNTVCDSGCLSPGTFTSKFSINTPGTYYYRVHVVYNGSDYWSNEKSIIITSPGTPGDGAGQVYSATVSIGSSRFEPEIIFATRGDIILWVNDDRVGHTVTSNSGNEIDSQTIPPEGTYVHQFNKIGTYEYHCSFHPYVHGSIVVD